MAEHETILDEMTARRREVHAQLSFAVSERLSGSKAEEWANIFTTLARIEEPSTGLLDALKKFLPKPAGDIFALAVDYGRSVADGIRAGNYDHTSADIIASNFPTTCTGTHEVKVELLHLDRDIFGEAVLQEIDAQGYRSVDPHELLAFGEKYPKVQREFPVVALGSVWQDHDGDGNVLYLEGDDSERGLNLSRIRIRWSARCRFAVVRMNIQELES